MAKKTLLMVLMALMLVFAARADSPPNVTLNLPSNGAVISTHNTPVTFNFSVAKFTFASVTPSNFLDVLSTAFAQAAQVIPSILRFFSKTYTPFSLLILIISFPVII